MPVTRQDDIQGTTYYASPEVWHAFHGCSSPEWHRKQMFGEETIEFINGPEAKSATKEVHLFNTSSDVWSLGAGVREISGPLGRLRTLEDACLLEDLLRRRARPVRRVQHLRT